MSRVARALVKGLAEAADVLVPPGDGVVVLLYHQVGGPRAGPVNLPVGLFDEQVAWLAEHMRPVRIDEALVLLDQGSVPSGPRPVVVTFDDGTADVVDHALPVLERHRVPALLYAATRWIDEGRSFWDDGTVLSWGGLGDGVASGWLDVGSHTHDHLLLDRSARTTVVDQLDRSVALIEDHLGTEVRHFAYPKALRASPAVDLEVRRRFRSAALAGTRPNGYGTTDPFALARTPVQVADGMHWFFLKARGGLGLEDRLREKVVARRYAGSSS